MTSNSPVLNFEMTVKKIQVNNSPPHRHRHFEIISVLNGHGKHFINGNLYDYTKGDLFMLTPQDLHTLKVAIPSEFCIIDFTSSFFAFIGSQDKNQFQSVSLFGQMEYAFHNHHRIKGNIIAGNDDRVWVQTLINRLLWEKDAEQYGKENISRNIVFILLQLITRHIGSQSIFLLKTPRAERIVHGIINFIHQNIYDKEALRIESIARNFHKSKDHISLYFKQQTGTTLKKYISNYKLELVKTRLLYSDLSIASVAAELDFTDESHLNKVFKRKFGVTASAFRKNFKREAE